MAVRVLLEGLKPIRARDDNLAEAVYEALTDAILSARLAPGTVLSALEVSKQMDVSRTPVQQALVLLAADGLVENENGRRARVARFTADDLFNIFEMRRLLESQAAHLAAGRMDRRQLQPLRFGVESLSNGDTSGDWLQRWAAFDEQFHRAIAESCGNPLLMKDIARYRLLHRWLNLAITDVPSLVQAVAEHGEILTALEARDGNRARRAMDAHIVKWQMIFVARLSETENAQVAT